MTRPTPAPTDIPDAAGYAGDTAVRDHWDAVYADRDRLWSGNPNGALLAEAVDLPPGRCSTSAAARGRTRSGWPGAVGR